MHVQHLPSHAMKAAKGVYFFFQNFLSLKMQTVNGVFPIPLLQLGLGCYKDFMSL